MKQESKMRILVLCTGNSCRSQMAEGFLSQYGGQGIEVFSAGLKPKGVNPLAITAMDEIGIDISKHTSDHLSKYNGQKFDYLITVCDNAAENCPVFAGEGTCMHWPFDDPANEAGSEAEIMGVFRRVRDEIGERVKKWVVESSV